MRGESVREMRDERSGRVTTRTRTRWTDVRTAEDGMSGVVTDGSGAEARWATRRFEDASSGLEGLTQGGSVIEVEVEGGEERTVLFGWQPEHLTQMTPAMARSLSVDVAEQRRRVVCVCGHAARRHSQATGRCHLPKWSCDCREVRPVIEVLDTRLFLFGSRGTLDHALVRGMTRAAVAGSVWRWLDGQPECAFCDKVDQSCQPIIVNTRTRTLVMKPGPETEWNADVVDMLICHSCCTTQFPDTTQWLWPNTSGTPATERAAAAPSESRGEGERS